MSKSTPTSLTPEQSQTSDTLRLLLGTAIANRYVDFCKLMSETLPLHTTRPLAAHALRELEALVRAVLATPMDAVLVESTEAKIARRKAVKAVKAYGYSEEVLRGVSKQLEPRLNHKRQIERICERLGFQPDDEVVACWQTLREVPGFAHQRNFDKSLRVDEEFREKFAKPFDVVMRGIASALQDRYAVLLRRAIEIAAMPPAQGIRAFVSEIPGAGQLQHRFYESLASEEWLPLLQDKGLLGEPLFTPAEDDTGFRQWAVGRYLLQMAKSPTASTRAMVVAALRSLATSTHPDVQLGGIEIAAALPADDAAMVVDTIAGWLVPGTKLFLQHPATLMKNLARGGHPEAALHLAGAFFQIFENEGRPATLHDQFMYEHFLSETVGDLIASAPVLTVDLFCNLLRQIAVVKKYLTADEHGDHSHTLIGDFDGNPQHRDIPTSLAVAIADGAAKAIHADRSRTADVVARIRSGGGRAFERIAMHVVATSPGNVPELATAYLTDANLIGATWCRAEYDEIANVWFSALEPAQQASILERIDAFVDEKGWEQWFTAHHGRSPSEAEAREYRFSTVHDIAGGWRNVLPAERQRALDAGATEFGTGNDRRLRFYRYATSPRSSEEMHSAGIEATLAFLRDWASGADENSARESSALASEFRTAVSKDPVAYSRIAVEISDLASIFGQRYLEAMDSAAFNAVPLDWSALLPLLTTLCHRVSDETKAANPYPLLRSVIALMASGLRNVKNIDVQHRDEILSLVTALHAIAFRTPEPEQVGHRRQTLSFHDAQQTFSGAATEICVLALNWLDANADRSGPTQTPAAAGHELLFTLSRAMADRSDAGAGARAIMGKYLNLLYRIQGAWLKEQLPTLLPQNDESLRDCAWLTHLQDDVGPTDGLITQAAYHDCYVGEIERMSDTATNPSEKQDHRLAGYVITLHLRGSLPRELLNSFLERAPSLARQEAMRLVGLTIGANTESSPPSFRDRARAYWLQRLSAAKACDDRSRFAREIGSMGLWFLWGVDDDWLMDQLLETLAGGYAPNDLYTVVNGLAKLGDDKIDRVVEVLEALVTSSSYDRYAFMVLPGQLRKMLSAGKIAGSQQTRGRIARIVNVLAAKGEDSFLDLLE